MTFDRERPPYRPGDIVGTKYRLVKTLGEGGMSVVYDAVDTTCARKVAVKVIRPRYAGLRGFSRERMQREAQVLVKLHEQTEFVVDVLTTGITGDAHQLPFYVMERLRGDTLRQCMADQIARDVDFTMDEIAGIAIPMAVALAHAHALGVIHRDTKPENTFMAVTQDGRVVIKVLDFGICAQVDEEHVSHQFAGTLAYAAPEQLEGRAPVAATDVYALGLVLFELATLKLPHGRHRNDLTLERLTLAVMKNPAPNLSTLRLDTPPRFAELVAQCLSVDDTTRPSAQHVAKSLRDLRMSYLGELSGATKSQSAATDVTGPPIEVLQAALAAITNGEAPQEVGIFAGTRSVDLGAVTDVSGVLSPNTTNDDVIFCRASADVEAGGPHSLAVPLSAITPVENASAALPGVAVYPPSDDRDGISRVARPWGLEDQRSLQGASDRLAANQFLRGLLEKNRDVYEVSANAISFPAVVDARQEGQSAPTTPLGYAVSETSQVRRATSRAGKRIFSAYVAPAVAFVLVVGVAGGALLALHPVTRASASDLTTESAPAVTPGAPSAVQGSSAPATSFSEPAAAPSIASRALTTEALSLPASQPPLSPPARRPAFQAAAARKPTDPSKTQTRPIAGPHELDLDPFLPAADSGASNEFRTFYETVPPTKGPSTISVDLAPSRSAAPIPSAPTDEFKALH